MSYKIVDNFLPKELFDITQHLVTSNEGFSWFSSVDGVAYPGDNFDRYFTHTFYKDYCPNSSDFEIIRPILSMLDVKALLRAKANYYTRNNILIEHGTHTDFDFPHKAFILYLNTNNGFTRMCDESIVHSVANRAVFFTGNEPHNSTNCTDALYRINIAINYF